MRASCSGTFKPETLTQKKFGYRVLWLILRLALRVASASYQPLTPEDNHAQALDHSRDTSP